MMRGPSILTVNPGIMACLDGLKSFYADIDPDALFVEAAPGGPGSPRAETARFVFDGVARIMTENLDDGARRLERLIAIGRDAAFSPDALLARLLESPALPDPPPEALEGAQDGSIFVFFAIYFARPFLKRRALLRGGDGAGGGFCPGCASPPSLAFIVKEPEGGRILWCHRCDSRWTFPRMACPLCGAREQGTIGAITIEGEGLWSLSTCDACRGYLKTYDERPAPSGLEADEDKLLWSSVLLDVVAQREGYKERSGSIRPAV